jgi:hypothetical protein
MRAGSWPAKRRKANDDMDAVMKLPHATKAIIACCGLYLFLSFFSWQRHSFGIAGVYAQTLWHGFGILVALTAVAYLGWELMRAMGVEVAYESVSSALISAAGAGVLLIFNLIVFLTWGEYRTWAAWGGILLALVIGGSAVWRARSEGVQVPGLPGALSFGSGPFSLPLTRQHAVADGPPEPLADAQALEA